MKTNNQPGFIFKMIGGKWVRADQFLHLEADNSTMPVWWPVDRPDVIPTNPATAVIISDQLKRFLHF